MMDQLIEDAARRGRRYLRELGDRPVGPSPQALAALDELDAPLPDEPSSPAQALELLDRLGSPATVATAGPRFFGFVIGGVLPAALAANWLAGAWDQNAFSRVASPAGVAFENAAARWVLEALGLAPECAVSFVTGASMANFTGLAAARRAVLAAQGWDVEADGLSGAPPVQVIVGEEAHPTVIKALGLLGLGRARIEKVPVDGQGRLRADRLPQIKPPAIVCLQAGNVNTGAFDPFGPVCEAAHAAGAWVHVDGAFGLWAAASPKLKHLSQGVDQADSWATDGHKWLNVPYDSGLAIVRRPRFVAEATSVSASYLPEHERYTPEASRRARGVEVWAALKSLGRQGLADLVERTCRLASRFAQGFERSGYQVLNDVVLNQVLVSFGDDETTKAVIAGVQEDGICWCGGAVWQGKAAMRISVSSWATTDQDVDRSLEAMLRVARNIS